MTYEISEATKVIIEFLKKGKNDIKFDNDTNLFEAGILDSLQFMNFLMLLEEVSGKTIDVSEIDVMDFSSVNRISSTFLAELEPT